MIRHHDHLVPTTADRAACVDFHMRVLNLIEISERLRAIARSRLAVLAHPPLETP